jgi:hypothetical protein
MKILDEAVDSASATLVVLDHKVYYIGSRAFRIFHLLGSQSRAVHLPNAGDSTNIFLHTVQTAVHFAHILDCCSSF